MKELKLTRDDDTVVSMSVEENGVSLERQVTIVSYEAVALLVNEYDFRSVLDVGCGAQAHAKIFRAFDKRVCTIDPVFPADLAGDFLDLAIDEKFDVLFCSHVLEHQRNIGIFLDKIFDTLPDNGILAITVPPVCAHWVTLSHPNWFNAGMLLYHLVMAGFDCRDARVLTYAYNTSVVLRKKYNGLPRQSWAFKMEVLEFLPAGIHRQGEGFNGAISSINWVPVLDPRPHPAAGISQPAASVGVGPTAAELRLLINGRKPKEAAALLKGVDLSAPRDADFYYYAGLAFAASAGDYDGAIGLLKRAAEKGFDPFWCACHLGQFEMKRGQAVNAAAYYAAALILRPDRTEIHRLVEQVAGEVKPGPLRAAQTGAVSAGEARGAFDYAAAEARAGRLAAAAHYLAITMALDPELAEARTRLAELAPDLCFAVMPRREPGAAATGHAADAERQAERV